MSGKRFDGLGKIAGRLSSWVICMSTVMMFIKTSRKPRSVNGDECRLCIGFRKLPIFREAVKPRPVGGDRSHGATFFTMMLLGTQVIGK